MNKLGRSRSCGDNHHTVTGAGKLQQLEEVQKQFDRECNWYRKEAKGLAEEIAV